MTKDIRVSKPDITKGGIKDKKHYFKMMLSRENNRDLAPVTLPYLSFLDPTKWSKYGV